LGEIAEEHLQSPSEMKRLYALKALAYIAGDLEKNPDKTKKSYPNLMAGGMDVRIV
jgi:hypothetical protein